jgi:predicted ArsR family transcriptional regulator
MPNESPDLAAWTRAVLATFWQAEHPLTRDQLAASLGASRETIDATLDALSARGLIASKLLEP